MWVEDIWWIVCARIAIQSGAAYHLIVLKILSVTIYPQLAAENVYARIQVGGCGDKPFVGIVSIDLVIAPVTSVHGQPRRMGIRRRRRFRCRRSIALGTTENWIAAGCRRLGEGNKLGHRAQGLVQAVELVSAATHAGAQAAEAIKRAVDAAVVGEIHDVLRVVVEQQECERVLGRMDSSDCAAAVGMGQVEKRVWRAAAAIRYCAGDLTFVKIDCTGIKICSSPIGNCREFQVVSPVCRTAAQIIAAIGNA